MKRASARTLCVAAFGALACAGFAQEPPPQPVPKAPAFLTPRKAPSPEAPQNTTNASAQAQAEYDAARAKCDMGPRTEREKCINEAEEHFYSALAGTNPGEQGNPGGSVTETGR